ncbi:amidase [Xylariaceae sp. FL0594]|nr:amidase [Xylariaceae sp. FL0594]
MEKQPWQEVVRRKRDIREQLLREYEQNATRTSSAGDITQISSLSDLSAKLASGEVSSEAVTRAYIKRAIAAHRETNCITEVLFNNAIHRAKELDEYFAKSGKPVGPLHGIPISLKDQFDVAGFDSTLGYVARSFQPATRDCALVEMLKSLGAVVIAKTNLPQSIMWCETENPLWGLTTNPMHPAFTPGGSTGGEAALLAMGGSVLGWGTDLGGSVRMPCHMMGLYGLKPSNARLPYRGVPVSTEGQEHVPSSVGPMARSLDTIHTVFKALIELKPWEIDARCAPVPWREDVYQDALSRPLVIGVLADDGVVRPHPPIARVLKSAVELLENAGHEIVVWDASLHAECVELMDEYYTVDGGEDIRVAVQAGGEPFLDHVQKLIDRGTPISVVEYWHLNKRKWALHQRYLQKWNSIRSARGNRPVDVVLMPPMPHTSVPHQTCRWVGYTKVWNLLDYPAIVLPGGQVISDDLSAEWDLESRNEMDAWNKGLWNENKDLMASLGLPVGVQLVGKRYNEEIVLAAGKVLDDLLKTKAA